MNRLRIILLLLAGVTILACERVIDIPLNDAERKTVVEGTIYDTLNGSYVKLSRTGSVYDNSDFEQISGATVTVTEGSNVYIFTEDPDNDGCYINPTIIAEPNKVYDLSVDIDGELFTATTETFDKPSINEMYYEAQYNFLVEFDPTQPDTVYQVFYDYSDNGNQQNFYRVNCDVNGAREDIYYIFDDKLYNGENNISPLWAAYILKEDTVTMELQSMDQARYRYLYTLLSATPGAAGGPAPANPVTNISGNALGFFSAVTTDTLSIITQ